MRSLGFSNLLLIVVLVPSSLILVKWLLKYYSKAPAGKFLSPKEEMAAVKGKDDSTFFLATFQEIVTKLKEKEKELKQDRQFERDRADNTELFSEKIISSIESALITIDPTGRITTFNSAAEKMFKIGADIVKESNYKGLFSSSPLMISLIDDCLHHSTSYNRQEVRVINESGEALYLGAAISPIKNSDGSSTGVLCLITDLTEIMELQNRIKIKENLAALGEMSAGIAHEFKNSLATILGHAQIMTRESTDLNTNENISAIISETRSLLQVVASFLDFAKPSTLHIEEFNLSELIKDCLASIEAAKNFPHVELLVSGNYPSVKGDKVLLRQALMNLFRNAFEAISADRPQRKVWIRGGGGTAPGARNVEIQIEDTGVGITEAGLEKIFLPFYTTKRHGTGLGLAIAQKIVVLHNGKITAQRKDGKGMIFTVSLPSG